MSDLKRLDEALAGLDHKFHANTVLVPGEEYYVMRDAARAYRDLRANGQRVEWCETCNDKARPPCWNSVGTPIEGHGLIHSIVSKILIGPPTEEV